MNTKHTPGPWTIDGAQVYADGYVYTSSTVDDDLVVEVNTSTRPYGLLTETDKANLALIAAAPKMLIALQHVAGHWEAAEREGDDAYALDLATCETCQQLVKEAIEAL